jgi:hypothetical protein
MGLVLLAALATLIMALFIHGPFRVIDLVGLIEEPALG